MQRRNLDTTLSLLQKQLFKTNNGIRTKALVAVLMMQ